jgi:hypothetical protein
LIALTQSHLTILNINCYKSTASETSKFILKK